MKIDIRHLKRPRVGLCVTQCYALALTLALAATLGPGEEPKPPSPPILSVYLPRSVTVSGETLRLGELAAVRSKDAALAARAEAISLGRASWAGETIAVDRRTILSRLAADGIPAERVDLTGADVVAVRRKESLVTADRLVAAANEYLARNRPPVPNGCAWRLSRTPPDLLVQGEGPFELKAELAIEKQPASPPEAEPADRRGESAGAKASPDRSAMGNSQSTIGNEFTVVVSAVAGRRTAGRCELSFRVTFAVAQAVAVRAVRAGEMITPANARLETVRSDHRPDGAFMSPYGKVAAVAIDAGAVIRPSLTAPTERAAVVRRNQSVVMRIDGAGFVVTALGLALADGRPGDFIKVRNVDSLRIVTAKVNDDGTVEPACKEN